MLTRVCVGVCVHVYEYDQYVALHPIQGSTKRWGVVVTEEDGWQGVEARRREREGQQQGKKNKVELSEAVSVDQFEKAVASKYKDSMLGFQTEFMVSYTPPHTTILNNSKGH